jgi:hypothetical protein
MSWGSITHVLFLIMTSIVWLAPRGALLGVFIVSFALHGLTAAEIDRAVQLNEPRQVEVRSTPSTASSTSDNGTSEAEQSGGDELGQLTAALAEDFQEDPPETWRPARSRGAFELGYAGWNPTSRSGSGSAEAFLVDYSIDPVTMIGAEGTAQWDRVSLGLDYRVSLEDREIAEHLLGFLAWIPPGHGNWWGLKVETGHVQGTATTRSSGGEQFTRTIDTEWFAVTGSWRRWNGYHWSIQYEDLSMPSIINLDDEVGTLIVVFDPTTRWRTVSLLFGYDGARKNIANQQAAADAIGWDWTGSYDLGVGVGAVSYDAQRIRDIAAANGVSVDDSGAIIYGLLDLRLGMSYTWQWSDAAWQLYGGGRMRLSGWTNFLSTSDPASNELEMDTTLGLAVYGLFARFSVQW